MPCVVKLKAVVCVLSGPDPVCAVRRGPRVTWLQVRQGPTSRCASWSQAHRRLVREQGATSWQQQGHVTPHAGERGSPSRVQRAGATSACVR